MNNKIKVILQARTSSSRLPAKSLLPVGGMPLAIFCAKRLMNSGLDVVAATSNDATDSLLASKMNAAGVPVFRGSLSNVLERFIECSKDLGDEDIVVRTTADNPFPDGHFIEELLRVFHKRKLDCYRTLPLQDGLPDGLSAQIFKVRILRKIAHSAPSAHELEHVTPMIHDYTELCQTVQPGEFLDSDYSKFRCTIDTLDDYLKIAQIFELAENPVGMPWKQCITALIKQTH